MLNTLQRLVRHVLVRVKAARQRATFAADKALSWLRSPIRSALSAWERVGVGLRVVLRAAGLVGVFAGFRLRLNFYRFGRNFRINLPTFASELTFAAKPTPLLLFLRSVGGEGGFSGPQQNLHHAAFSGPAHGRDSMG